MISLVRQMRARGIAARVAEQREFYTLQPKLKPYLDWQLDRFNAEWSSLRIHVPYWRALVAEHRLPNRFASWEEFSALLPPTSRAHIQSAGAAMIDGRHSAKGWRSTGGSTGQPLRFPVCGSEPAVAADDLWYARSWFGICPADKLFLIWGHSHLLGDGLAGWLNARKREFKDWFLGYHRCSAYRLGDDDLRAARQALLRFRPAYVLGYATALDRFSRVNAPHRDALRALKLKAVIATAESFPSADSREALSELFGCPIVMEYGAVETGPLAHQRPDGVYQVLWRNWFIEAVPFEGVPGARQVLVTSLYARCLPLIRYQLGDLLELTDTELSAAREFRSIVGRCNDLIHLPSGQIVHSEAITHAVKESAMGAFQVRETPEGIQLRYAASRPLTHEELADVRRRLVKISPGLETVAIDRVDCLDTTIAGKMRRVLRQVKS